MSETVILKYKAPFNNISTEIDLSKIEVEFPNGHSRNLSELMEKLGNVLYSGFLDEVQDSLRKSKHLEKK